MYVPELSPEVTTEDIRAQFENHGDLVEEVSVLIRRAHVSTQVNDLRCAEMCKMILDQTPLKGCATISYDGSEVRQKGRIVVMFPYQRRRRLNLYTILFLLPFPSIGAVKLKFLVFARVTGNDARLSHS